ncbi:MAG TPA: DUF547 domain-containing protein [Chthoniobacteraceae bacterium]|nr:DUF547 domain-containing protein [Chthoniobacteraceae bacterium]
MKTMLVAIIGSFAAFGMVQAGWQEEYGRLLKKYVTPNGVQYAAWKASAEDVKALGAVTDGIAAAPASTAKTKEQLAFYINAYNAWILHEALEKYPTRSVKDPLFAFFIGKRITVAGEKMSFNHLEKEIIRPRFNEPRVHFALNCASRSCPPLRNEPYVGATLEAQLEDQANAFVNSPKGVTITRQGAALSKIFDWYRDDFGGEGGVIAFINKRRNPPLTGKISYQEYDWNLNETR